MEKEYKYYLDKGVLPNDYWVDIQALNPSAKERLGYPTQKPLKLLERIIKASSNEGDTILDAYCGCGTTVDAAQKLGRNWIGIDITYQSIVLIIKRIEETYGKDISSKININGIPKDMDSAIALANRNDDRIRKEFEKWAILTYSDNRAAINHKKGADRGIDGCAYFAESINYNRAIILQVKSGKVSSRDIRDLYGTVTRENAAMGIFITLNEPTSAMIKEANSCGNYYHNAMNRSYENIQIVTIKDMIENKKRLGIPLIQEVIKSSERKSKISKQLPFLDEAV
ncbi:DNA methyltransferase [Nostoc sp. 'Peltigera malacea cyanobiont' DB3992]|uniref:DNA methyltransferase n=1 Tax=Nostoc sp. 'Peltigera malacea cyanobiont' DB3992 TaxID=1206980 RepID=UPI000C042761|nr:DNA methyltransferase [Nostoc sp. 'Peltigera malacea cyanobiont' DB3992]PHM09468.1 hypothetical protein CK516_14500 [Nostoc sp. 'Peltigera malacea cyanobiont' DB3992]